MLNVDYAISVLRQEAFASLTKVGVSLDKSELTLTVGNTADLTAIVAPVGSEVTWKTSKAANATVADGKVTAVAAGQATITAEITYNGTKYSATCAVTVEAAG